MATTFNINIVKGQTFKVGFRLKDEANNNVFAGATSVLAQVRETVDSNSVLFDFDASFTPNNETLWLQLTANETAALVRKPGVYDIRVEWPDRTDYIVKGSVKIQSTVSRDA